MNVTCVCVCVRVRVRVRVRVCVCVCVCVCMHHPYICSLYVFVCCASQSSAGTGARVPLQPEEEADYDADYSEIDVPTLGCGGSGVWELRLTGSLYNSAEWGMLRVRGTASDRYEVGAAARNPTSSIASNSTPLPDAALRGSVLPIYDCARSAPILPAGFREALRRGARVCVRV